MKQFAGYGAVFGEDGKHDGDALACRIDTILTSVGAVQAGRRGIFVAERVRLGELTEHELNEMVVGDLGGLIIPKQDLNPAQARRIGAMNERWTGMKQPDLDALCRRGGLHQAARRRCARAGSTTPRRGAAVRRARADQPAHYQPRAGRRVGVGLNPTRAGQPPTGTMRTQTGLGTFAVFPVGSNAPVLWLMRNTTNEWPSWFATIK